MRLIVSLFVFFCLASAVEAATPAQKSAVKKNAKSNHKWSGKKVASKGKKKPYKKQKITRVKLFDTKEFSKLTFTKKKAFLKAVSDYLAATGKDRKVASYDSLMDLLIPSADAATVYLRNAGFMTTGESRAGTAENFDTRQFFNVSGVGEFSHACGADKPYPQYVPCYPGLGLDANDKAFCVANTPSQLTKCLDESNKNNGIDNLAKFITAHPDNMPLRAMLGNTLGQINAECKGAGASSSYCSKLNASIAKLKTDKGVDLATYLDDATLAPPSSDPTIPQNESCFEATKFALETIHGGKLDPRWTAATSLAKRNCGLGESWDEALRHYGDCYQNDRVRRPMEMPTSLKAILGTTSDLNKIAESGQLKREFATYFGMTVDQFKTSFCQQGSGAVANSILRDLSADGSRLDLNGVAATPQGYMATALDNMRKSGVNNVDRKNLILAFNKVMDDMRNSSISSRLPSGATPENVRQFAASAVRMLNATDANAATVEARRRELEAVNATGMEAALRLAASYTTYTTATTRLGTEVNNAMDAARRGGDGTLSSSEMTAANNSFQAMQSCVNEAILPATTTSSGMESIPAQSRYNSQCQVDAHSSIRLDGLASDRATKPIIISNGNQCYFFEGLVDGDSNSANMRDVANDRAYGPKTLEQLQSEGFSILQFRCDGGGAAPAPAPETGDEAIINI